ncbi:MAG: hypothetical protein Q7S74_03510 [Nanoarchaeota archaeon]|nr:hypothetical protein [Nanoarchaeota archaeon]
MGIEKLISGNRPFLAVASGLALSFLDCVPLPSCNVQEPYCSSPVVDNRFVLTNPTGGTKYAHQILGIGGNYTGDKNAMVGGPDEGYTNFKISRQDGEAIIVAGFGGDFNVVKVGLKSDSLYMYAVAQVGDFVRFSKRDNEEKSNEIVLGNFVTVGEGERGNITLQGVNELYEYRFNVGPSTKDRIFILKFDVGYASPSVFNLSVDYLKAE